MEEKENILDILKKSKQALTDKNTVLLKQLSDRTIHTASIYQDSDNISVAIIIYSLSKIIERKKYEEYKSWDKFYNQYTSQLDKMIVNLEKDNIEGFRENISKIRQLINQLSGSFRKNIQDVFRKASINKASKIYEHGISMEQTSKLLGISIWELAEYAGQTGVSDVNYNITMKQSDRIKYLKDFLK